MIDFVHKSIFSSLFATRAHNLEHGGDPCKRIGYGIERGGDRLLTVETKEMEDLLAVTTVMEGRLPRINKERLNI